MPSVTELQFDGRLTNVSKQHNNPELIADLLIPPTPVSQKTGLFKTYTKANRFTVPSTRVGPKSVPNEVEWTSGEETYTCEDQALQEFLNQEEVDNAETPFSAQSDTTEFVTNLIRLAREIRMMEFITEADNYAATTDAAGTWGTADDGDVLDDIHTAIDACFMPPNVMVMDRATFRNVSTNTIMIRSVQGTVTQQIIGSDLGNGAVGIRAPQLAAFFGLDRVLIGTANRNTANAGLTASFSQIWRGAEGATAGFCSLLRIKPSTLRDVSFAYQFDWKPRQVMTSQSDRGAFGGQIIRVAESTTIDSSGTDVGHMITDTNSNP